MTDKNKWLIEFFDAREKRLWGSPFEQLSSAQQVFVCTWELEAEVNNGGFHQYFFNSAGDHADKVLVALESIGAVQMRRIVGDAVEVWGSGGPPQDRWERQEILEKLDDDQLERLEVLDQAFFQYPDDLTSLLYDYVQQHPALRPNA